MQKAKVFLLTFLAYVGPTAMRYGWAYTKPQLSDATGITMQQFGIVDFFYVGCYSFGFIVLGSLIHKTTLKTYVTTGICAACISYMFYPIYFTLTHQQAFLVLLLFMSLNGFFQATVWPGIIGIFGNWFKKDKNGTLLAIWAMSGNIGNIYASNICNILELQEAHWLTNFLVTGLVGIGVSILILTFLEQHPKKQSELAVDLIEEKQQAQIKEGKKQQKEQQKQLDNQKYGIFSLLRFPKVLRYVAAFACLKGCVYGLAFWLPTYFHSKNETLSRQKGFIISMYDVGSITGAITLGYIADRFNKRAMFLSPLLFLAMVLMLVITFCLDSPWQYYIAMIFTGISIGGPYNMICTVITMDLGNYINQKSAVARVSSLIEGVASLCSATSMIIIPLIPFKFTLYIFAIECLVGVVVLFPLSFQQAKTIPFIKNYLDNSINIEKQSLQLSDMSGQIQRVK